MIQLLMTNFLYKYKKKFIKYLLVQFPIDEGCMTLKNHEFWFNYLLVQFPIDEGCMTLKNHEFWNNIIDNNPVEMFPQI